jgi:hypothetical protein
MAETKKKEKIDPRYAVSVKKKKNLDYIYIKFIPNIGATSLFTISGSEHLITYFLSSKLKEQFPGTCFLDQVNEWPPALTKEYFCKRSKHFITSLYHRYEYLQVTLSNKII